jgi:plasmid stabilization system protein ParE
VASCLPDVTKVEPIDGTHARFTVRFKLGFLSGTSVYDATLLRSDDALTEFQATGREAEIHGTVAVRPAGDAASEVTLNLDGKGRGALGSIVDSTLKRQLPGQAEKFAAALQAKAQSIATG